MKTILAIVIAALSSVAAVSAQQSGGGGSGLPSTGTANQCLLSTGSGSGSVWGSCSGSASTNWSSIVPGTGSITAGTYTFPTGTTETFSGTGVVNANQINGTALSSLSTGILKNTTSTGVPSIAVSADVIALFSGTCSVSTYLRGDGACASALTGATSGGGLTLTGTTLGLLTSCSTNQVLQWNSTSWVCATISGGSGANTALSNLASVAVNTPLLVASAGNSGIGTKTTPFGEGNFTQVTNGDSVIFGSFTSTTNTGLLLELFGAPSQPADVFTVDSLGNEIAAGSGSVGTSFSAGTTGTFGSSVQIGSAGSLATACPSPVTALCWTAGSAAPTPTTGIDILWPNSGTNTIQASENGGAFFNLGSVTSIATTSPLGGGTITGIGTITCSTCATTTNGGALTAMSPATISAAGVIACATCATTTNGGALSATSPATISVAGVIACATCVTSSGGGALTATSPVTVSGAGLIAISGVTSEQGNGAKLQLSTGTTTTNDCVKFDANGNTIDAGAACGSGGGGTSALAAVTDTTSVTQANPTINTDTQLMELSLAANYLNSAGQPFVIHGSGVLSTTLASTPQVTITAKLCSVSTCASGTVTPLAAIQSSALNTTAITNASWNYDIIATTVGTGSSCNLIVKGSPGLVIENGASLAAADSVYADSNTAASTPNQTCTNALFLDFFVQQSAAGASNSYKQLLGAIMPQGGGPVISVSGDGTLITNITSTGAVTLALGTAGAHKWFGNNTGSTAAPGYQSIGAADLPAALSSSTSVNGTTIPSSATLTQTIANGTSALGTSAISSATCATVVTTSATGVATTDNIQADFNADPTSTTGYSPSASGMLTIIKYPTANNVNFKVCNNTSASITPGAVTLNWRVVR